MKNVILLLSRNNLPIIGGLMGGIGAGTIIMGGCGGRMPGGGGKGAIGGIGSGGWGGGGAGAGGATGGGGG